MASATQEEYNVDVNQRETERSENALNPTANQVQAATSPREGEIEVTVNGAEGLAKYYKFKKNRSYYVSATCGTTTKKSSTVESAQQRAEWSQAIGRFNFDTSKQVSIEFTVYVIRSKHAIERLGWVVLSLDQLQDATQDHSLKISYKNFWIKRELSLHVTTKAFFSAASEDKGDSVPAASENKGDEDELSSLPELLLDALEATTTLPDKLEAVGTLVETWKPLLDLVRVFVDVGNVVSEIHPYAKMAWSVLSIIPTAIAQQAALDESVKNLISLMKDVLEAAKTKFDHKPSKSASEEKSSQQIRRTSFTEGDEHHQRVVDKRQADVVSSILVQTAECLHFIEEYREDSNFWKRTVKHRFSRAQEVIQKYTASLTGLREDLGRRTGERTEVYVFKIVRDLRHITEGIEALGTLSDQICIGSPEADHGKVIDNKLKDLPFEGRFRFDETKRCQKGTRVKPIKLIQDWTNDLSSPQLLALFGQAGTGKSAIAHEIASYFNREERLASSFFFVRQSALIAYMPIATLIHDLCACYPAVKAALGRAVEEKPMLLRGSKDCLTYFNLLLLLLNECHIMRPIVAVFDALDECAEEKQRDELASVLSRNAHRLPHSFRIVVTSRLEGTLEQVFAKSKCVRVLKMDDEGVFADTHADIRTYVRFQLPTDVSNGDCDKITRASGSLFQWAYVACDIIKHPRGLTRPEYIQRLTGGDGTHPAPKELDELYITVLNGIYQNSMPESEELERFRFVMSLLFGCIGSPSRDILTRLVQLSDAQAVKTEDEALGIVRAIISPLRSVLSNVTEGMSHLPIAVLHTSFRDFMTIRERSGKFFIDVTQAQQRLARACFRIMLSEPNGLRYNICDLSSSFVPNADIRNPDLQSRVQQNITSHLSYACQFWDDHLKVSDRKESWNASWVVELIEFLEVLFKEKLLYWLEVLSVMESTSLAIEACSTTLKSLIQLREDPANEEHKHRLNELISNAKDAIAFVHAFGTAIARSTPHIYVSALLFSPALSTILQTYQMKQQHTSAISSGGLQHWPALQLSIPRHGDWVRSVAFSPDGTRIISGSDDGMIKVWDAITGEAVAGPFRGHKGRVRSVAFSPDGNRIVSGSDDKTITVWDATTGKVVAGPFTGHTEGVTSVAFSPDGARFVSGSEDHTLIVWDATVGDAVVRPAKRHTEPITSVAFSLDGTRIVSGSDDKTIRVWHATTGEVLVGPFTGHTEGVRSVAFSPDGARIVSGSNDKTIRVWNATIGEILVGPFEGHTEPVTSVAFSPDGTCIVSGSDDCTVGVWDAITTEAVAGPFEGHTLPVTSVAFSSDSTRIVSGSWDQTIKVWDATASETIVAQAEGHTDWVLSVAFSHDGTRIVSGLADNTIKVWDATTGEVVAGPLEGHLDAVQSVAFSQDDTRIVSGSDDNTIRVWDAATGEVVVGPFEGHTKWVVSVAFSPDGTRIVSGSGDETIRVWDATTGEVIAGPFEGHTDWVRSVTFSPDGTRIVSGSGDQTIRVWDATTGQVIVGPLEGHTNEVNSVAFTPDGTRVLSGSDDRTIRMWDAATGEVVAGSFIGHTDWIGSVAFSPDGAFIVSGSGDQTIRVWDAATGEVVAGPFGGHTDWVQSVAFSLDGARVVSGSNDQMIRVWDLKMDEVVAKQLREHTHQVESIASLSTPTDVISEPLGEAIGTSRSAERRTSAEAPARPLSLLDAGTQEDDGWITGENGELLLWVPVWYRRSLCRPSNSLVIGREGMVRVDWSRFVCGEDWATCFSPSP